VIDEGVRLAQCYAMRRLILAAGLCLASCSAPKTEPAAAPDRLYVSNEIGNSVMALDSASGVVVQTIAVGRRPRGLMVSPDGARLYVAVSGSPIAGPGVDESKLPPPDRTADGIAVVDLASGKVERVIPAGADPETFALSRDGRTLFVSNEDTSAVSAVATDGARPTISAKIGDEPEGVAVTPDGTRLFVACEESDHVAMLDARTLKLIRTIPLAGRPRGALMAADGGAVYISVEGGGQLAVIDTATGAVRTLIDVAQGDKTLKPMGIVEATGGNLFVTTGRGGIVVEIDPKAGKLLRRIEGVGARPWGIAIAGSNLVTANGPSGDVTFIDRTSGKVIRKVPVGRGPWGVASKSTG
jgi:YVTN family beta-propeller protein